MWLIINPSGDQPLFALLERATGLGSATFLNSSESDIYESAARDIVRFQGEVDRLDAMEKAARYQGSPLADDEIRRIASYQQTFNEMMRGERFKEVIDWQMPGTPFRSPADREGAIGDAHAGIRRDDIDAI